MVTFADRLSLNKIADLIFQFSDSTNVLSLCSTEKA